MQPMQALQSDGRCRPARSEHGFGARLRRRERGKTAAMEQAGIVEAGHDGHERIESRTVLDRPSVARRAECRQANPDRVRQPSQI